MPPAPAPSPTPAPSWSASAPSGEAFYSPYAASKGAIIAATKSWSTELAPDVRVNAVAPGWVDTDMCIEPFADGGSVLAG